MSAAAAVLGPTIGIAVFFMPNRDNVSGPATSFTVSTRGTGPVTEFAEDLRSFAPRGLWLNLAPSVVQERKPQAATVATSSEPTAWPAVVTCSEGRSVREDGRCPAPEIVSAPTAGKRSIADVTPPAGNFGSGEIEILERAPFSPFPGRMSVGGP